MLWDPIFGQWPKKELVPNAMQHYITCDLVFTTLYRKFPDSQWGVSVVLTAYAREVSEHWVLLRIQFAETVLLWVCCGSSFVVQWVCCGNNLVTSLLWKQFCYEFVLETVHVLRGQSRDFWRIRLSNVCIHSYHKYFTISASVLYRTYNIWPSARVCISDTTRPQISQCKLSRVILMK